MNQINQRERIVNIEMGDTGGLESKSFYSYLRTKRAKREFDWRRSLYFNFYLNWTFTNSHYTLIREL